MVTDGWTVMADKSLSQGNFKLLNVTVSAEEI